MTDRTNPDPTGARTHFARQADKAAEAGDTAKAADLRGKQAQVERATKKIAAERKGR